MRDDEYLSAAQLIALLDQSEQLVAIFDERDFLRYANTPFRKTYGLRNNQSVTWEDLIRIGNKNGIGTRIETKCFESWLASAKSRRGKMRFRLIEVDLIDGRWILMAETTIRNNWMLCIGTEVSNFSTNTRELRIAHQVAVKAALTDELTQLSNRRHLFVQFSRMLSEFSDFPFCVVAIDLDNFKSINDLFGHEVGDKVLRNFADVLREQVGRKDISARIGGDEFILIVCSNLQAAVALMTRILNQVRNSRPVSALENLSYSCSAGVVAARRGERADALVARADRALYAAKARGRDQIVVHENSDGF